MKSKADKMSSTEKTALKADIITGLEAIADALANGSTQSRQASVEQYSTSDTPTSDTPTSETHASANTPSRDKQSSPSTADHAADSSGSETDTATQKIAPAVAPAVAPATSPKAVAAERSPSDVRTKISATDTDTDTPSAEVEKDTPENDSPEKKDSSLAKPSAGADGKTQLDSDDRAHPKDEPYVRPSTRVSGPEFSEPEELEDEYDYSLNISQLTSVDSKDEESSKQTEEIAKDEEELQPISDLEHQLKSDSFEDVLQTEDTEDEALEDIHATLPVPEVDEISDDEPPNAELTPKPKDNLDANQMTQEQLFPDVSSDELEEAGFDSDAEEDVVAGFEQEADSDATLENSSVHEETKLNEEFASVEVDHQTAERKNIENPFLPASIRARLSGETPSLIADLVRVGESLSRADEKLRAGQRERIARQREKIKREAEARKAEEAKNENKPEEEKQKSEDALSGHSTEDNATSDSSTKEKHASVEPKAASSGLSKQDEDTSPPEESKESPSPRDNPVEQRDDEDLDAPHSKTETELAQKDAADEAPMASDDSSDSEDEPKKKEKEEADIASNASLAPDKVDEIIDRVLELQLPKIAEELRKQLRSAMGSSNPKKDDSATASGEEDS